MKRTALDDRPELDDRETEPAGPVGDTPGAGTEVGADGTCGGTIVGAPAADVKRGE